MKLRLILLCVLIAELISYSVSAQQLFSLVSKADSLRQLGEISAIQSYKEALAKSLSANNQDTTGLIYLRLGIVYERRSLYQNALDNYFKSLERFERISDKSNVAAVKKNIGNVYRILKNFDHAFNYVHSSYLESKSLKDSLNIFSALNDLGLICMDQNKTNEALSYFNSVLLNNTSPKYQTVRASAITNLASIYWITKKYFKALNYYQQAYQLRKNNGEKYKIALTLLNIGGLYNDMHQYNKALHAVRQGLNFAKEIKAKDLVQYAYNNYSDIYTRMGNYRKAYKSAVESMAWQDSVYSDVSSQYMHAEAIYQRDQEETKNKLLIKETNLKNEEIENNKKIIDQRNWLLVSVIIIAALIILSLLLFYKAYRSRQHNERIIEKQRSVVLESQLKESELTALRAQMNPHFIFNALSSIKNYMLEQNIQLADYYLGKFAKLIRLILDNSSQNFVSLEKELQLLESYIQLEQLRFENKFSYNINIMEEINTMETFIPSMIIQPFVENAIIHGFMHKEGKCHLNIDIRYFQTYLLVTIEDDGIGRRHATDIKSNSGNTAHQSKGYKISEQRLKVLSGGNTSNTGIVFKDLGDDRGKTGTLVEINIPLEQKMIM